MLEKACKRLLEEAERVRDETIAAAEEEYQRAVQAVALLQALEKPGPKRLSHGRLLAVVQKAIDGLDEPFTVRDIADRLQELAPDVAERVSIASISTTLRRMVGGRLRLAEQGSATRPSMYRKASYEERRGLEPRRHSEGSKSKL